MKMRKKVDYIRENIRKYGVRATLHDLERRVINTIANFRVLEGMTVRLQDVNDPTLFEAQGFEARFVGADELAKFAREPAYDISADFLHKARARRSLLCALRWRTACGVWLVLRSAHPDRRVLHVPFRPHLHVHVRGGLHAAGLPLKAAACGWDVPGAAGGHRRR